MSQHLKPFSDEAELPDGQGQRLDLEQLIDRRLKRDPSGCLLWQGGSNQRGLPQVHVGTGILRAVHRLQYVRYHGPVPAGLAVKWTCGNKRCLEPTHLVAQPKDFSRLGRNWSANPDSEKARYMRMWKAAKPIEDD